MSLPSWLVEFVPAWEEALRCVIAGATLTALWRAWCNPKTVRRRVVGTVSMVITFLIAVPVVWARTHDPSETLANAIVIGAASPVVWQVLIAAALKWAPWLAVALGEDRRHQPRNMIWTHEQRRRMFEDTDKFDADDIAKWRKDHGDG